MAKKNKPETKVEEAAQQEETHAQIVEPEQTPEQTPLTAAEFVRNNIRRHRHRANSTKLLRLRDEVSFYNAFTEQYLRGELDEDDIKILADVKAWLRQLPNNPYNLKDDEANAFVCDDMHHLCINGEHLDGRLMKFRAISISTNRVGYYNPVLAQEIIAAEQDEDIKAVMQERLVKLEEYPARDGYGSA